MLSTSHHATKFITTRSGKREEICLDKITDRLRGLCGGLNLNYVNPQLVAFQTIPLLASKSEITTSVLDDQSARSSNDMVMHHPDYGLLSGRILSSNQQKSIHLTFSETVELMFNKTYPPRSKRTRKSEKTDNRNLTGPGLHLTKSLYTFIMKHRAAIDAAIVPDRDFQYDYFAVRTMMKSYLFTMNKIPIETIQYMLMRVACSLWCEGGPNNEGSIQDALDTYEILSLRKGTNASPTLMNAGSAMAGLASCYGIHVEDSLDDMMDCVKEIAIISRSSGGVGLDVSDIRALGQLIRGTNGISDGLLPFLRVVEATLLFVSQGGGRRSGSGAIYINVFHSQVIDVLTSRMENSGAKNNIVATKTGLDIKQTREREEEDKKAMAEKETAQSLFYASWCPDMFFLCLLLDRDMMLTSPDETPDLHSIYGREFNDRYLEYSRMSEAELPSRKRLKARDLARVMFTSSSNTGTPYVHAKDTINARNTVKHIDPILQSNLCCEIVQPSSGEETFVCNLSSICLPTHVKRDPVTNERYFDFDDLIETVKRFTSNVNRLIDQTSYPSEKAKRANLRYSPAAIGVQGLADVFCMLRLPFISDKARALDRDIAEALELGAMCRSNELGIEAKESFYGFETSELAKGRFQHDLAFEHMTSRYHEMIRLCENEQERKILIDDFGWPLPKAEDFEPHRFKKEYEELALRLQTPGTNYMRNAFWIGYMPTASTSALNGNTESFEPITGVVLRRSTGSGEFFIINKYFVEEAIELGIWNEDLAIEICNQQGSVQNIACVPDWLKEIYKTRFEYDSDILDLMNAERQKFIDQACSYNFYSKKLRLVDYTRHLMRSWRAGAKTIHYYTRTLPAHQAQQYKLTASNYTSTITLPVAGAIQQQQQPMEDDESLPVKEEEEGQPSTKKRRMQLLRVTPVNSGSCTGDVCEA